MGRKSRDEIRIRKLLGRADRFTAQYSINLVRGKLAAEVKSMSVKVLKLSSGVLL